MINCCEPILDPELCVLKFGKGFSFWLNDIRMIKIVYSLKPLV